MKIKIIALSIGIIGLFSCKNKTSNEYNRDYTQGVIIVEEGLFTGGTGTISFFDRTQKLMLHHVFDSVNQRPLGNIGQSVAYNTNQVFIVVNNANKLEKVNRKTFKNEGTIYGFQLPDEVLYFNNLLYVSEWVDFAGSKGNIAVIDPHAGTFITRIPVGITPSKMAIINGTHLAVTNSGDSTVSYINLSNHLVEATLVPGAFPNSIVSMGGNEFSVLCGGIPSWAGSESAGSLVHYQGINVVGKMIFPNSTDHPKLLIKDSNNNQYFVLNNSVYQQSSALSNLTQTPWYHSASIYDIYGLGFDPVDGLIWLSDAKDYTSNGEVYRVKTDGTLLDQYQVGIIPRNFGFLQ